MTKTQIPNILFFFLQIICSPSGNAMMVGTTTSPTPIGGQPVSSTLKAKVDLVLQSSTSNETTLRDRHYVIQLLDLRCFILWSKREKRRRVLMRALHPNL